MLNLFRGIFKKEAYLSRPWEEREYKQLFENAHLRISPERAFTLVQIVKSTLALPGDLAELGVYKGSTAYIIAYIMKNKNSNKKLYLFDTFCGTPKESSEDKPGREGMYKDVSLNEVQCFLKSFSSQLEFRPGFIPSTFAAQKSNLFCFVHLHLNLYKSTKDAIEFLFDRMCPGGIILVEDYGLNACLGVKKAADEFLLAKASSAIHLPTGQGVIIKHV